MPIVPSTDSVIRNAINVAPADQITETASEATLFEAVICTIGKRRRYATLMVKYAKQTIEMPKTKARGTMRCASLTSAAIKVEC